jgi:2-keto-4-pentenoate hydratase
MPTQDGLAAVAERLREAERTRMPVTPFAHELGDGDIAAGYAVQAINVRHWTQNGRRVIGRKIGLTNEAVQRQLGVDQPDYGTLFADMQIAHGGAIERTQLIAPRIEAEIALILAEDLTATDAGMAELAGAVAMVVPALEIVDSRIKDWQIGMVDTVADNGASARFVLGPEPRPLAGIDLAACSMALSREEQIVSCGAGSDCLGNPLNAALWLARKLATAGAPLRAGDVILTGALGPMVEARASARFEARIKGFSPVCLHVA